MLNYHLVRVISLALHSMIKQLSLIITQLLWPPAPHFPLYSHSVTSTLSQTSLKSESVVIVRWGQAGRVGVGNDRRTIWLFTPEECFCKEWRHTSNLHFDWSNVDTERSRHGVTRGRYSGQRKRWKVKCRSFWVMLQICLCHSLWPCKWQRFTETVWSHIDITQSWSD